MNAGKLIAYIGSAILIFFGVLFIWSAFSPTGEVGNIFIGIVSVLIGFGLIFIASRRKPQSAGDGITNVTLKVDLPANVKMDEFKCRSCGGVLSMENVQMVAGAPVVSCPYCKTTYQLTEEPKW